jgi:ribosome-binding factor A
MTSRRVLKAAEAIRHVVSMAILTDLNDPRVQNVTVTYVEVTPDLREAKVHVSIMGDETKQRLSLAGLRSAAGYLQSKISDQVETRYVPRLQFELDLGVKKSIEMAEILRRVLPADSAAANDKANEATATDEMNDDYEGEDFPDTDDAESDDGSGNK